MAAFAPVLAAALAVLAASFPPPGEASPVGADPGPATTQAAEAPAAPTGLPAPPASALDPATDDTANAGSVAGPEPVPPETSGDGSAAPAPAAAGASPRASRVSAESAWESALPGAPLADPVVVARPGADPLIVLALAGSLQARFAADGSVAWERDLDGRGLAALPVDTAERTFLGWAGVREGSGWLHILDATDGRTLADGPLEAVPSGPPTAVAPAGGAAPLWYVPLEDGRVAVAGSDAKVSGWFAIDGAIDAPLLTWRNAVLAVGGDPPRLVAIGSPARRARRTDIDPDTARAGGPHLFGAGDRTFVAWHCRQRAGGIVRCRQEWLQKLGGSVTAPPLVREDAVIVASWDTHLYSFHPDNGHLLWRTHAGPRLTTSPVPWDDELFAIVPAGSAEVLFFRYADGAPAGSVEGDALETFLTAPARAGDTLVVTLLLSPSQSPAVRAYRLTVAPRRGDDGAPVDGAPR